MQKYIVLLFLGLFSFTSNASNLTIQPRFTNSFRFTSTDVWNIDVQFTGTGSLNAYFLATITSNGKPICTVKSGTVLLTPGAQSFTTVSINTALLSYQSQGIGDIENITGTYPSGTYKVCYNAYCVTSNCDGLGSNVLYNEYPECFDFLVEPPTPLLLAFPEDKAELEWNRPTFNWIPPMPLSGVAGFNYNITLVEADKNQSCPDAITRNRPIYNQRGVELPTLPYPAELGDLDTGKTYCWKVDGLVEDIPVAQSEVWEFKLKKEKKEKRGIVNVLPKLTPSSEPYMLDLRDTVQLLFTETYQIDTDDNWNIKLIKTGTLETNNVDEIILTPITVGTSNIQIIPLDSDRIKVNTHYMLHIENAKHEVFKARIIFYDK